jgi:hypothetical protein
MVAACLQRRAACAVFKRAKISGWLIEMGRGAYAEMRQPAAAEWRSAPIGSQRSRGCAVETPAARFY